MTLRSGISLLPPEISNKISSGQVIQDVNSAVKELVENSLDSQPHRIAVDLREYGLEQIQVIDDGEGIEEEDFNKLGVKHCTSKLSTFSGLNDITTHGF
ncbi:MAG: putative DNA mismatch repair protein MutL [Streblomastix strix]|uniref:Putative DNA mismatch repair protein MutL n=1 Tax=Streblomastix strix TaxID=222440 RepID=A0A5J4X809_9EUKA|nr:MAG: putative DNA mismatch repair protein MutL [Streblomastix strix]